MIAFKGTTCCRTKRVIKGQTTSRKWPIVRGFTRSGKVCMWNPSMREIIQLNYFEACVLIPSPGDSCMEIIVWIMYRVMAMQEGSIFPHRWNRILGTYSTGRSCLAREFIRDVCKLNPKERPTAAEALNHRWLEKFARQHWKVSTEPSLASGRAV
jgi:hypothetical protein